MSNRLRFKTARELFEAFPTAGEDMAAKPSDQPALDFLSQLAAGPTPEDAITFSAYLLPRREAVWWGCQCLARVPDALEEDDARLLGLAQDWVRQPEEVQRAAALAAGMAAAAKTPGAWMALAAGWSGGSMLPPDAANPVKPPPHLTAKAVNAGVLGALARVERGERAATLGRFVDMGIQLANQA